MVLQKYNLYIILDGGIYKFIILGSFLQIINVDKSIEITKMFKSLKPPNLHEPLP